MRIVLITQDEPFFLPNVLPILLNGLSEQNTVVGCVLLSPSPFGKKESILAKVKRTISVFGVRFFAYYSYQMITKKWLSRTGVRKVLIRNRIKLLELEASINHETSISSIQAMKPDMLISVLGNQIFKEKLLNIAPCLNLHTAPLPRYRGLMPTFWVLQKQEAETAVSVFLVDEGIDSGPIVVQKPIALHGQTQKELIEQTKLVGMHAIVEAVEILKGNNVETLPNNKDESSYYGFPTRQDVKNFRAAGAKFF